MANTKDTINNIVDEVIEHTETNKMEDNITTMPRPFVIWAVAGKEYRLKLTASWIIKLENQFGKPLMMAVTEDGIPAASVVTTLLQAALQKYNHGIKSSDVEKLYDDYMDAGNTIYTLLNDVIYPLMYDAGFFTRAMLDALTTDLAEMDQMM